MLYDHQSLILDVLYDHSRSTKAANLRSHANLKKNKIFLIEDCALALGSKFKKKHVGLFGEIGSFSFYPVKHITTAEGGMVISKIKTIIDKVKKILGMDITIVTSANTTEEGKALLVEFGFPFEKK